VSDEAPTVLEAVREELARASLEVRLLPESALVWRLAELLQVSVAPRDAAVLSKELRAAWEAQRDAVRRMGKRGDVVDEIRAAREARLAGSEGVGAAAEPGVVKRRRRGKPGGVGGAGS